MKKFTKIDEKDNKSDKRKYYGEIFSKDLKSIINTSDTDDTEWSRRINEVIDLLSLLKKDKYEELEKRYPSNI